MVPFEIGVNGKPLYRTGVGQLGMLTAEVMWARIAQLHGTIHEEQTVMATSMAGDNADCHSQWPRIELRTCDEILIRIVDAATFDDPEHSGTLETLRPPAEE